MHLAHVPSNVWSISNEDHSDLYYLKTFSLEMRSVSIALNKGNAWFLSENGRLLSDESDGNRILRKVFPTIKNRSHL